MTLLRRPPREVYRVYGEAEFFDGAASVGLFEPAVSPATGERRLRRLAGVAALAGAVGAVGTTIAVSSRPAGGGGRRALADAHATARTRDATRTTASAGSRVGEVAPPPRRSRTAVGSPRPRDARRDTRRKDHMRRGNAEGARRYAVLTASAAPVRVATAHALAPVPVPVRLDRPGAASVDVARLTASRTVEASQPQHAEFGFER